MRTSQRSTPTRHESRAASAPQGLWCTATEIADFGVAVSEHGLAAYPHLVQELARSGRHLAPVASEILSKETEPTVMRERALAVVSAALVRALPTTPENVHRLDPP